ncbi:MULTISPECIES: ABC transporter ATP-binding protein [unclassified Paracoccus (in: a-proteobacteria)]|uniref:ABC transporter ATP-binding protein n=1 Tax=unclassified Paracoccus (in: a-proteobacteria) TaxID=2688777 RepID=UPI001600FAAD|nr:MULTISPECIES: ABC transporter ATP-binding protein [unclassified Paracoccus (in: a-proteobacteria)]MBB1492150.1 ABC transporter ATP-binding protein [Paracoccus sp. MC1854]MBB1498569.1 ABC transporter ATP-binding protein [Paracoccus sp. MC1862]QQO44176.1 ABC transporter ATP-binding protein [Paracoccus sp. MC1862]
MTEIRFQDLSRRFGGTRAVDGLSACLPEGSFTALLGPSGCGKSTLLRLIAGLERPDAGSLWLGGELTAGPGRFVEPEARGLGMVFQSYALWPHMTVAGNIGFGLNRLPRPERDARIREALATTGLQGLDGRKPHELSGGQRQRVALARSLAARPRILLLDESLANLDAHLRQSMLAEFRRIHAATGCTMVFVTHDQNEAMAVASLVGVMQAGRLEQLGSPQELYDRPRSEMVARFIGYGRTLPVTVTASAASRCEVAIGPHRITLPGQAPPGPAWLCLHARDLAVAPGGLPARIAATRFEDGFFVADVLLDDLPEAEHLSLRLDRRAETGERIGLAIHGGWVLPRHSGEHAMSLPAPVPATEPA